jgi:hypothetical protein
LVGNAKNVCIKGIPRIKCEICARVYLGEASDLVQAKSQSSVATLFFRVQWDVFHFVDGYEKTGYNLLVNNEFTGNPWLKAL